MKFLISQQSNEYTIGQQYSKIEHLKRIEGNRKTYKYKDNEKIKVESQQKIFREEEEIAQELRADNMFGKS